MKSVYILFFVCLSTLSFGQSLNPYIATERLQASVAENPDDWHEVLIQLADQVDVREMDANFYARNATLQERTFELITALKDKKEATQPPFLSILNNSNQARNIRSFWVSNIIYAELKLELLAELSQDTRIEMIELNTKTELVEHTCDEVAAPPVVPNGKEAGLTAIGAPEMWAMGYTGYGTVTFTSDTGVDPLHPALIDKYRGNGVEGSIAWYEFDGSTDYPNDCDDHGTHVTGTMVGLDRTTNDTIGVAFNAQWIGSATIVCNDNGTVDNVAAFEWALDPDGDAATIDDMPDVINNSWRDPSINNSCQNIYVQTLNALEATKVAVVFSAGNEGPDPSTMTNPHNINTDLVNTFTIGALNGSSISLTIADFSSRGPSLCAGEGSIKIKPEVSAPGVSVRSCVPGNGYDFFSGTSMASPHTCGAILLLREAFPNTTATEIKLALYFSAIDLGEEGEDNVYGMGIINVPAAYQYLIDQGHVPTPPTARDLDVAFVNLQTAESACSDNLFFETSFENIGIETITSVNLTYEIAGVEETINWTGELVPGQIASVSVSLEGVAEGDQQLQLTLDSPNNLTDDRPLNNKIMRRVTVLDRIALDAYAEGNFDNYCEGSEVTLRVDYEDFGDVSVEWFDQAFGGVAIGEGDAVDVGPITETTTYYAEGNLLLPAGKETIIDAPLGDPTGDNPGLRFDAFTGFKLKSVLVYFDQPGLRFFRAEDSNGNSLGTRIVDIQGDAGFMRAALNFNIPEGNGHRIFLEGSDPLLSNTEGASFPYVLDGIVNVKRSNSSNVAIAFSEYQCFYDWEIEIPDPCGRVAVTVEVVEGENIPTSNFDASATEIDLAETAEISFTEMSDNATDFLWNFGDNTTSTEANPSHSYSEAGTYFVSLTAVNEDGCSDSKTIEITVTGELISSVFSTTIADWDITIFPNPTNNKVTIDFNLEENLKMNYRLVDVLGKEVIAPISGTFQNDQRQLSLTSIANGVYYLILESEGKIVVKKIVKM